MLEVALAAGCGLEVDIGEGDLEVRSIISMSASGIYSVHSCKINMPLGFNACMEDIGIASRARNYNL